MNIFIIKKDGTGGLLQYSQERYNKLKDVLKKDGYREATKAEIESRYDLKEEKTTRSSTPTSSKKADKVNNSSNDKK